ncbi:hypothetical protein [Pseudomonas sichuanensis]|uniref:hypothetical protein n=1 Tax=Pseudomonas TaxID=286 RepID=UPI0036EDB751
MTITTTQSKASWSGPSLAIAVAAACALMAGNAAWKDAPAKQKSASVSKSASTDMETLVERAVSELSDLETSMSKYTKILCQDHVPDKYLQDHPFGLIADNLRFAENRFREFGAPKGGEADYNKLIRALAKARSVAAMNDSLIKQRTVVPEVFHSDVDLEGLSKLTAHTTQRLIKQIS